MSDINHPPVLLSDWCHAAWQVSKDHGWHDDPDDGKPSRIPIRIALMHSEVSELLEAYRRDPNAPCDKPGLLLSGAAEELADIVIRLFDYVVEFKYSPRLFSGATLETLERRFDRRDLHPPMAEQICELHKTISMLSLSQPFYAIDLLIQQCARFAVSQNIDLEHAVRTKHEYNKTRAHKHGGKAF